MWGTSSFNTEGAAHFAVFGKLRIFFLFGKHWLRLFTFCKNISLWRGFSDDDDMGADFSPYTKSMKLSCKYVVMAFAMVRLTAQTSLSWQSYSNWSVGTVPPLLSTSSSGLIWGFSSSAHIHVDSRHSHLQNRKDSVNSHLELLRTFYSHVVKIIHTSTNL